jgi:DNA excision repair protein ERCC-3
LCDSIDAGNDLSERLDVPFVSGETPKRQRMDIFRDNRVVIGSRVADEGFSMDKLDRVIEYDFHSGSRRQELQRAGRVMHSEGTGQHIIQMTDDKYENYSHSPPETLSSSG